MFILFSPRIVGRKTDNFEHDTPFDVTVFIFQALYYKYVNTCTAVNAIQIFTDLEKRHSSDSNAVILTNAVHNMDETYEQRKSFK